MGFEFGVIMKTAVVVVNFAQEMLRPHRPEAVETENLHAATNAQSCPESHNKSHEREEVIITSKAPLDIQEENHFLIKSEGADEDEQKKGDISSRNNHLVIQESALVDENTQKNNYESVVMPVHSLQRWGGVEASKAYNIDEDIVPSPYVLHRCLKHKVKTLPMVVTAREPRNKGLTLVRKGLTIALPPQVQAQATRKSQLEDRQNLFRTESVRSEKDRNIKTNQDDRAMRAHGNAFHSLHKWGIVKATTSSVFGCNNNNSMSSPCILQIYHGKAKKMVANIPLVTSMEKGLAIVLSLKSVKPTYQLATPRKGLAVALAL